MPRPAVTIVNGEKMCSLGKHMVPLDGFDSDSTKATGLQASCRACRDKRYGKGSRNSALKFKYGITAADYERLYEEQEGRCLICNTHHEVLCVDHDHVTKKVRGLLCRECNFGLGKFGDDPQRLLAAVSYLMSATE